jgi:hypothetical protein
VHAVADLHPAAAVQSLHVFAHVERQPSPVF